MADFQKDAACAAMHARSLLELCDRWGDRPSSTPPSIRVAMSRFVGARVRTPSQIDAIREFLVAVADCQQARVSDG